LRVAVFVDYENIRRRLESNFQQSVSPREIAKALRQIAGTLGEFRFGKCYGDWAVRPKDARDIEREQFKAEHVLRTPGGKDRADAAILVELGDQADSKDFDLALIATGDADFSYAIRKLREKGKKTAVTGVSLDAARELFTVADTFIPIEKHLGLEFIPAQPNTQEVAAWVPFVRRMLNLEERLPFVVRNYVRDRILEPSMGAGATPVEKEEFLKRAEADGIIERAEVDNPKLPGRKVATIRLRRNHVAVAQVLLSG
jgi:uncharacterized LabA/DUF88 family protein